MAKRGTVTTEQRVNVTRRGTLQLWVDEVFGNNASNMARAAGISPSYLTKMLRGTKSVPPHLFDRIEERVRELKALPASTTGAAESFDASLAEATAAVDAFVASKPATGPVSPGREVLAFAEAAEALSPQAIHMIVELVSYRDVGSHLAANTRQAIHHIAQIRHLKGVLGG